MRNRSKILILLILLALVIIAYAPGTPLWLTIILLAPVSCLSVLALLVMSCYYSSLPDVKKSLIGYMMIYVMVVMILLVFWLFISTIIIRIPSVIQGGLQNYPEFICGLLGYEELIVPVIAGVIAIVIAKIFVLKDALTFHDLNHEKWFKGILALVIFSSTLLILLQQWSRGSLCKKMTVRDIELYTGIKVTIDPKKDFPARTIIISLMAISQLIYLSFKKFYRPNIAEPGCIEMPRAPSMPSVLPYNLRVLRGETPVFEQEPLLGVNGMRFGIGNTATVAVQTGLMRQNSVEGSQEPQIPEGLSIHEEQELSVWTTKYPDLKFDGQMPPEAKVTKQSKITTIQVESKFEEKKATFAELQPRDIASSEENTCISPQSFAHGTTDKLQVYSSPRAWTVAVQTEPEQQNSAQVPAKKKRLIQVIESTSEAHKDPVTEDDMSTPVAVILTVLTMLIAAIYLYSMPYSALGTFTVRLAKAACVLLLPIYWVLFSSEIFAWMSRKLTGSTQM